MKARGFVIAVLTLSHLSASSNMSGNNYDELHAAAVSKCQAIDSGDYQSGLFFNPDGYRSYYLRSLCFQEVAILFRDIELCAEVRQRRALFSSSWGYSKSNCKKLVAEGRAKDREAIDQMKQAYANGHVRLEDFRIERNGNGRDFDIIPGFSGKGVHAYELRFELIRTGPAAPPVLLHASGFSLEGAGDNIRIYVPQTEIRRRFPAFAVNNTWPVRATLVYSIGSGTQSGKWSDAFIESRFPVRERTQTLTREIRF
jgi:hypothetical protein